MAGLLGSMYTGNSGLQAASKGVSVVGDNIANTNTVGFKSGRIHFQEMLQEYIVGASGINQVGRGVQMSRIEKLFTQGELMREKLPHSGGRPMYVYADLDFSYISNTPPQ